ncbi:MAG: YciI family protein [Myxococcaceae bacterium]
MKFIVMVKATAQSEAGAMPDEAMLMAMGKFNEALQKAGLLLDLAGLHPTSKGSKVVFDKGSKPVVVDGPFAEAKELVAGYWMLQAKSKQEVEEWIKRAPMLAGNAQDHVEVEIRPVMGMEDFADSPAVERQKKLGEKLGLK